MIFHKILQLAIGFFAFTCCQSQKQSTTPPQPITTQEIVNQPITPSPSVIQVSDTSPALPVGDDRWVDLEEFAPEIKIDIKYATKDNFTKKQIYDCPKCLLRPEVAEAVLAAHKALQKQGYGLLMKDCYRPGPYQQRLWDAVPDENYVAHPSKGSMHSRGVAVDLTLVDTAGKELDMGTPYDFFGPEAHTAYTKLPDEIMKRRRLLKKSLEDQGFNAIKYEWWHYNWRKKEFPLSNYVWPCK
jgi:zinc D-Ala-D-Ala dipeptidase